MMGEQTKDAAAYIRVSTRSDSQLHSFAFQENYWWDAITSMPGYRLKAIYADKGISGKAVNNRKQFQNMIAAAKRGEFKTIFTKSVARFARNTVELLMTVRELAEYGVNVIFESENIDTTTSDSEMQLTLAAAIAEEQLRAYGQNMQWMIKDKFSKGQIVIGRIYGYKLRNGKLEVVENEAKVVQLIYSLYLNGMGKNGIANELTARGIPTMLGGKQWCAGTVNNILRNEKYAGNCLQQKSVKMDGTVFRNQEIVNKYYMEGTHEPVVSQEDWNRAQEIRREKINGKTYEKPKDYVFRSKIMCGNCGRNYVHKINNSGKKWAKPIWRCLTANRHGKQVCDNKPIYDNVIEPLFVEAYNNFVKHIREYQNDSNLMAKKKQLLSDEHSLKALSVKGMIPPEQFKKEYAEILDEIAKVDTELKHVAMNDVCGKSAKPLSEFDEDKVREYLERATIKDSTVTFEFINGYSVMMPYSNGQSGNKKGWKERRGY